ncbi:hypothetical protein BDQ12DRAFT_690397 [Crucibulum laeve]|uniref:DEAD/DEAH box helicase domain-containing protein n=1 Tax=Crucibulum laeve TaxID=68775 RepID=A0A5C3LMI0_9AGAR|nr:hypothetical protein BDQ12DRAFT_690397 [Crucibulum laeve]
MWCLSALGAHQLDHRMNLVQGRDVFLAIATGEGKTTVLHAPLQAGQAHEEGFDMMNSGVRTGCTGVVKVGLVVE